MMKVFNEINYIEDTIQIRSRFLDLHLNLGSICLLNNDSRSQILLGLPNENIINCKILINLELRNNLVMHIKKHQIAQFIK